jgi:hypothetical protein
MIIHAYVNKDVVNQSIAVITGESNGIVEVEPVDNKNNSGQLVRVIEGLMDMMDNRHYRDKDYNNGKYIIKAGEFCRVQRIENIKENENEKVG